MSDTPLENNLLRMRLAQIRRVAEGECPCGCGGTPTGCNEVRASLAPATDADWMEYERLMDDYELAVVRRVLAARDHDGWTQAEGEAARKLKHVRAHVARMSGRTPEGR